MIQLPNNCYCSEPKIYPKNWKTPKASLKKQWYIYYRFYDPQQSNSLQHVKRKQVHIKRMNKFTDLAARQAATREILDQELMQLTSGYNPISGRIVLSAVEITPAMPLIQALREVEKKIKAAKSTKRDLKSILNFVAQGAEQMGIAKQPVGTTSRKHIKLLLLQIESSQKVQSPHRFNKIRSYLMILFNELVELEALENNPVREIAKQQALQPIRSVLSQEQRKQIDTYLHENHYYFWRFMQVFFHSGARLTELMHLTSKDVNLVEQTFTVVVKKGNRIKQVMKPIKDIVLPLWSELMAEALPNDYLFSKSLFPGSHPINTDQITKRWNRHVKKKLHIDCDFYSLKHLNLDETAMLLNLSDAAAMASHVSTSITLKHYTYGEHQRQMNRLKAVNNSF